MNFLLSKRVQMRTGLKLFQYRDQFHIYSRYHRFLGGVKSESIEGYLQFNKLVFSANGFSHALSVWRPVQKRIRTSIYINFF